MVVDGKIIAADILNAVKQEVVSLPKPPHLTALTCNPNFETKKYLEMKRQKASATGIDMKVIELLPDVTTAEVITCIAKVIDDTDGIVVQLPFPGQIDRQQVLDALPVNKDPDGFAYGVDEDSCLPPVVAAIDEISKRNAVNWHAKKVIVLGSGRLVGKPAAEYAQKAGALVTVVTEKTYDSAMLQTADIIVSGIGKPHFITSKLVKDGVIIFDAGTSEDGGVLAGDANPAVAKKASLFTPVPGGIGPITIACLLRNVVNLARQ